MANLMNTGAGKSTPAMLDVDTLPTPTEALYNQNQLYRYNGQLYNIRKTKAGTITPKVEETVTETK